MSMDQKSHKNSSDKVIPQFGQEFSLKVVMFHQAVADRLGLNVTDHKCLGIIINSAPITAGQLSEIMNMPTGSITTVIDRLEKVGYIRREKDPHDRRRVVIQPLMKKIEHNVMPIFSSFQQAISELYAHYSSEEIVIINDFLVHAMQVLDQETTKLKKS